VQSLAPISSNAFSSAAEGFAAEDPDVAAESFFAELSEELLPQASANTEQDKIMINFFMMLIKVNE